ncbi:MAG: hypothetical protein PVG92_07580 [Holophagae bacterium]
MGRKRGSYQFEKRQKELKKQKKKLEKLARRQNKGEDDDIEAINPEDLGLPVVAPPKEDEEPESED